MELSIIVPVYNVEKYLERCLDSLVNQTLEDHRYEIIVVNDGSPDNSQRIIDRYAEQYNNLIGLQKTNGGLSDARNYGLHRAKGRYVAFVDSDDYVDIHMYEKMLEKASRENYDMVVCDFIEVYVDRSIRGTSRVRNDLKSIEEVRKSMIDFYPSAWNKIYKKELFKEVQFKKGVWFEDVECMYRLFPHIHSVGIVEEPFYYYIQREGSISKSTDPRIFHCVDNWNGIVDYYNRCGFMDCYREEIEYSYVRYLYATFLKASLKYDKKTYNKALQTAHCEVKKRFPKYRKNKYFYQSAKGIYCLLFSPLMGKLLYLLKGKE